jgi:hypothetical protein
VEGEQGWRQELSWQTGTSWKLGKLPAGSYSWTVWARNISGESEARLEFTVSLADPPPSTFMLALPAESSSTALNLQWDVQAGIEDLAYFELQVQENGGEWKNLAGNLASDLRNFWFWGTPGYQYAFRVRGVDRGNNKEAYPEIADASTKITFECTPDAFENNGNDNTWPGSAELVINQAQQHNYCGLDDVDWMSFSANAGQKYTIHARPVDEAASSNLQLIAPDRYEILGEVRADGFNQPVRLEWTAPEDGQYYLILKPFDDRLTGTGTNYQVVVESTTVVSPAVLTCSALFLPLLYGLMRLFQRLKPNRDDAI